MKNFDRHFCDQHGREGRWHCGHRGGPDMPPPGHPPVHGCHGGHGMGPHHGHPPMHCGHEGPGLAVGSERYEALDIDGKLDVLFREMGRRRMAPDGRGGQLRVLRMLDKEGTMSQRDLTERLDIRPSSASELVGKLERAELVSRASSEADRRSMDVTITDRGREIVKAHGERRKPFDVLTDGEKETLVSLLEKIVRDRQEREAPESK